MSNELQKDEITDIATFDDGFAAADGDSGFQSVDRDCVTIPFLKVAQSTHDETKRGHTKYIEGLEPGMFFCPMTRKIYGTKVELVILSFYRQYVMYDGEGMDSKFSGVMEPEVFRLNIEPKATRKRSYFVDGRGWRYVDTRNFIVFVNGHYEDGPLLMSMSSTGVPPSKNWLSQAQSVKTQDGRQAKICSCVWGLETSFFQNPEGSYHQVSRITKLGGVPQARRQLVLAAFNQIQSLDTSSIQGDEGHPEEVREEPMRQASPEPARPEPDQAPGKRYATSQARPSSKAEEDIF